MSKLSYVTVILAILLLQGCVSLTVDHKLNTDGSSDISYTMTSDNQMLLSGFKDSFAEAFAEENAVLSETNTSFTYTFEDVYPADEGILQNDEETIAIEESLGPLFSTYSIRMNGSGTGVNLGESIGEDIDVSQALDTVELNYDITPFGTVIDTNGQRLNDGQIRFDLTQEKEYFITFRKNSLSLWFSSTFSAPSKPEWDIGEWSECSNGIQNRTVTLTNSASYMRKPPTEQRC